MVKNIFHDFPTQKDGEYFESLVSNSSFKFERIISFGSINGDSPWYDQDNDEWVMVVKGNAILLFSDPEREVRLSSGDYILIKAHEKHCVKWTDPSQETIWLALHF